MESKPRSIKLGDYVFALSSHAGKKPEDPANTIRISLEEIDALNENYEVSQPILDFVLSYRIY